MAHTVKKLSALSGVSVRTLHFYDEIGLLKPARYGENGYRYYEREQLLLLQQILFFKELGLPLTEIQQIVSEADFDKAKALRAHRKVLEKNINKMRALIKTIDRTLESLDKEKPMKEKEFFNGFSKEKQAEYERQLIEYGGEKMKKHIAESKRRVKDWKKEDWQRSGEEFNKIIFALVEEVKKGSKPTDSQVQSLVGSHFKWLCQFWTPNRESYTGHGQMLAQVPDWRKFYTPYHPGLVDFFAKAIKVYADNKLR